MCVAVRRNWVLGQQSIRLNHLQNRVTLYHAAVHWSGEKVGCAHTIHIMLVCAARR